ncbi:sugar kinase [Afipia carboxidovorans]|uniref:sugar kinase n=1 Tax=Afipia carboxidovorans TaxID=40137 RepID=UPI0030868EA7|nr:sugar kinase [Afipia carboxidovorans]
MNLHQPPASAPHILCIGMPVRDLVFRVHDLPAAGHKVRATHFTEFSGGNALNAAVAIARLGGRVRMSGPMGDAGEKVAETIIDDLAQEGIDSSAMVRMPGLVTPISNIMIDHTGERTIVTYRDPQMWKVTLPDTDELLKDCDAILTENRCAEFVRDICFEAQARGIPVVLDYDRVMPLDQPMLRAATYIVFSAEALRGTAETKDDIAALQAIAGMTPAFVGVTKGAGGMIWLEDGRGRHMPSFPIEAVDTLGAGDVFHGAFTLAIAEGQSTEGAMRFSAAAAALKCGRHGGAFASPQRIEVEAFLESAGVRQEA